MARRSYESEVSLNRYVDGDDRTYVSSRGRDRRTDDRVAEEEFYRSSRRDGPVRERELRVREQVIERERSAPPPSYLREDYGRSAAAGPVVLRKRDVEDFEFAPRRRSQSPEPERRLEQEEIIIRRDEPEPQREEIIIRREERDSDSRADVRYAPPPPRREDREREEIIIRREERKTDSEDGLRYAPPPRRWDDRDREREEIIIRREERDADARSSRMALARDDRDREREEIIIRREERDADSRSSRVALARPVSHERERSRPPRGSESDQEIIIRRDQRDGPRGREREREEIIVRSHSRSASSDTAAGRYPAAAYYQAPTYPPPTIIAPPPPREDAISRAIDRDYEITLTPQRARSAERIAIHRSGEREGREYKEDIVIDRNDTRSRSPLPPLALRRDPYYDNLPARAPPGPFDRDAEEEAAYYNDIAKQRGYIGEAYHGATRDWALVDVPPGTRRVRMDGAGGGEQEITWQRYNGVRRSKFYPDGAPYDGGYVDGARPAPSAGAGGLGVSWGKPRDPRDGLWTEITKDLVVKEAIKEMGYEYEETDDFYYVFKYLSYEDMARLVGLSDDIKNARQKRIKEIGWENRVLPEPATERAPLRLLPEPGRDRRDHPPWTSDDERYIEREIIYRGGRPPPPPGWRR
ncbi:hypothetical protein DV737_g3860, partial [Chaetothyriales sp. CBS 132003]